MKFTENKKFIENNPLEPKGDVLVLAGDVIPVTLIDQYMDFF
ncbi:hypothetical protein ADIARSV_3344 [Arcticibacter svalbardensis MN12-7]|uniref:Uncharacterized protein n=1 Tax=Arcticibacter svalbardensis MN12-7 TaxID=1150600 RepID=R9GPM0_9SPHI|nr:hypothetical protein ADIARSV_3344 [Arcticibacter svalbardensis MN12-7]